MGFKKGDTALVKASVYTKDRVSAQIQPDTKFPHEIVRDIRPKFRNQIPRPLRRIRYKRPLKGIVVGWSIRISGLHVMGYGGYDSYDDPAPGELRETEYHKVIMIQPTSLERWVKPIPCLEEDLELLEDK